MGLGLGDFLDLTPIEWIGIRNKFIEHTNTEDRARWEIARWQVFRAACPPKADASGMLKATDFITFPWDEEAKKEVQPSNEELFKAAVERYK